MSLKIYLVILKQTEDLNRMQEIDRIVFGDNQFFGINHLSEEKAQQLLEKFSDNRKIFDVYEFAIDAGINGIMLNSNDRAKEICEYFVKNEKKYKHLNWYPSIPYPHKYANLVGEKGIIPAINEILFKNNTAAGVLKLVTKGSMAFINKDIYQTMKLLIDIELRSFSNLNIKVIFLQNIITDLLLGYDSKEIFEEYCLYIKEKYKTMPGFITANMPVLYDRLVKWGLEEIVICTSFNKIGYQMSPDIESYLEVLRNNDPRKYQIMAMSTLASGAIPAKKAFEFINSTHVQSIVFGASSREHIQETVNLIMSPTSL